MLRILIFSILFFLTNCTIGPVIPIAIEDIVKKAEGYKKDKIISTKLIEKPYEVDGKWFYPQEYSSLEEVGIARIIDDITTGSKTRNGEIYHDEVMMGAHRSLPLPSIVKVTNLSNGYSIRVRVNHRGAFSNTGIINLSSGVFKKLKLNTKGDLVKINLIHQNESFILNEAFTYEEEKKVIEAPISSVSIVTIEETPEYENNDLYSEVSSISLDGFEIVDDFHYSYIYIKVASFTFRENALSIVNSLNAKHATKIIEHLNDDSDKKYMVVIGPFKNIDNLLRILNDDTFNKYEDLSIFLM